MTGGGRGGVRSEINVTPLADVVLVLLIIFMVVTPLLQRGKDVRLPASRAVDEERRGGDPLIVSVTSDRAVFVDSDRVDASLEARLRVEFARAPTRPVLLKADASLSVGDVRRVMATAQKAGARGVRLAVEPVKDGAP